LADYYFAFGAVIAILEKYNEGSEAGRILRYEEALDYYDRALLVKPTDYRAWYNKGLLLHNLGRYYEAIDCYSKAITFSKHPENAPNVNIYQVRPLIWNDYGNALYNLNKPEVAKECYDNALTEIKEVDFPYIENNMAWCLIGLNDAEGASKRIDRILKRYNGSNIVQEDDINKINRFPIMHKRTIIQALFLKGFALCMEQRYEESMTYIEQSINTANKFSLKDALPYYYKANLLYEKKDYDGAIENYRQAIGINPRLAQAHDSLGVTLSKKGDSEEILSEAEAEIKKALEIKPSLIAAHDHYTKIQAMRSSRNSLIGRGPRFTKFWSRSKKKIAAAVLLIAAAVALSSLALQYGDISENIHANSTSYNKALNLNQSSVSNT
jgi:tetratricopeptide (TPR) repeat protein